MRIISFRCWPVRIRLYKPLRGGLCPVSVLLERRISLVPDHAATERSDPASERLQFVEALLNRMVNKLGRLL
jgi:hypothetical protein